MTPKHYLSCERWFVLKKLLPTVPAGLTPSVLVPAVVSTYVAGPAEPATVAAGLGEPCNRLLAGSAGRQHAHKIATLETARNS